MASLCCLAYGDKRDAYLKKAAGERPDSDNTHGAVPSLAQN
jgi:hypothetical protein